MPEQSELARIAEELREIKRLIIVAMMKTGVSQRELGNALGRDQSAISRMLSDGKPRKRSRAKTGGGDGSTE